MEVVVKFGYVQDGDYFSVFCGVVNVDRVVVVSVDVISINFCYFEVGGMVSGVFVSSIIREFNCRFLFIIIVFLNFVVGFI